MACDLRCQHLPISLIRKWLLQIAKRQENVGNERLKRAVQARPHQLKMIISFD